MVLRITKEPTPNQGMTDDSEGCDRIDHDDNIDSVYAITYRQRPSFN